MWKIYLFRKMPVFFGAFWLFSKRRLLVDRVLIVLTQKVFTVIGSRFPRLSFLKTTSKQVTT